MVRSSAFQPGAARKKASEPFHTHLLSSCGSDSFLWESTNKRTFIVWFFLLFQGNQSHFTFIFATPPPKKKKLSEPFVSVSKLFWFSFPLKEHFISNSLYNSRHTSSVFLFCFNTNSSNSNRRDSFALSCSTLFFPRCFIPFEKRVHSNGVAASSSPCCFVHPKGTSVCISCLFSQWLCRVSSVYYSDEDWHLEAVWKRGARNRTLLFLFLFFLLAQKYGWSSCLSVPESKQKPSYLLYFCQRKETVSGAVRSRPLFSFSLSPRDCRGCDAVQNLAVQYERGARSFTPVRSVLDAGRSRRLLRRLRPLRWSSKICTSLQEGGEEGWWKLQTRRRL